MNRPRLKLSLGFEARSDPPPRCEARDGIRLAPCRVTCLLPWRSTLSSCLIRSRLGVAKGPVAEDPRGERP
jgi:hypothetical protein